MTWREIAMSAAFRELFSSEAYRKRLESGRRILSSPAGPVDPYQLGFERGFLAALEWLHDLPEREMRSTSPPPPEKSTEPYGGHESMRP